LEKNSGVSLKQHPKKILNPITKSDTISPKIHSFKSFQTTGFPIWIWFNSIKDLGGNTCILIEKRIKEGESIQTTLKIPIVAMDRIYSGTLLMAEYIPSSNTIVVDDVWIWNNSPFMKPYRERYELLKYILSEIISYAEGLSWAKIIIKPLTEDPKLCPYEPKGLEYRNPSGMLTDIVWFEPIKTNPTYTLKRTPMFDVWEVFDGKINLGYAAVQTMELSKKLGEIKEDSFRADCIWNPEFSKWTPIL
jgi:hypothetical protein